MLAVTLDGTKIHANASCHSALSHEHAGRVEAQLKAEVTDLLAQAETVDRADIPDGLSIPDELARCEERLAKFAKVRAKIKARARERFHHPSLDELFAGPPPEGARRQEPLRPAQTHPQTRVQYHQIRARFPPVPDARPLQRPGRVEPGDHGLEPEADVRPEPGRLTSANETRGRPPCGCAPPQDDAGRFDAAVSVPISPSAPSSGVAVTNIQSSPEKSSPTGC